MLYYQQFNLVFDTNTEDVAAILDSVVTQLQRWQARGLLAYEVYGPYSPSDDQIVVEMTMRQPGKLPKEIQAFLDDLVTEDE